jgi:hypothetical protein
MTPAENLRLAPWFIPAAWATLRRHAEYHHNARKQVEHEYQKEI